MNWLNNFVKTLIDYFTTPEGLRVLVVIILTVILGSFIPAFGRFLKRLPRYIWMFFKMCTQRIKEWNYWRKTGPKWEVLFGSLRIEKAPQNYGYNLVLELKLKFTNRDNFAKLLVELKEMIYNIIS